MLNDNTKITSPVTIEYEGECFSDTVTSKMIKEVLVNTVVMKSTKS